MDWRCQPGTDGQWGPSSQWRNWAGGSAIVKWVAQTWPPSSQNHREGEKPNLPPPPPACSIQENQQKLLSQFKSAGGLLFLLFFSPSETIRPGAVKGPETDPKRDHKANPNNWETETISLCYSRELACYCLFVLLFFHYFYFFNFISFFFFFFLFSILHCICLFNCIAWLVFLVLSFIVYFNFPSFTSLVLQQHTTLGHVLPILLIQII